MTTFEELKKRKLKQMIGLRIMNAVGMVSWSEDKYGCAKQRLRLLHPFTWFWIVIMIFYGIFAQGVPETISDITYSLKNDTVIW